MNRIQKLPPILWTGLSTKETKTYVFYYKDGDKKGLVVDSPKTAFDMIVRAGKNGYAAFAAAPIPCNNNQFGVFAFSSAGCTKELVLAKNVNEMVNKAYRSVFAIQETKPAKEKTVIQKIDKEDPLKMVCAVNFDGSTKQYVYRCRKAHFPGDRVCVKAKDELKNVTVVKQGTMKESEIISYANKIGYKDLEEVYCEQAIDLEPDEEYIKMEMACATEMKEAFEPACDYEKSPEGYIQGNYDTEEDYDDLPE